MQVKNAHIASVLLEIADLMEMGGENPFKVNAFRRAARAVETSRTPLDEMRGKWTELPGIGKGTAAVIEEIVETGTSRLLSELREKFPPGLPELIRLPGLGPKSVFALHRELGVTGVEDLKQAAEAGKIRALPGFGPKKEQKILEAIYKGIGRPDRHLLSDALVVAEHLQMRLLEHSAVVRAEPAGSVRRKKETIKDVDLVVATEKPREVGEWIASLPEVTDVRQQGETKVSLIVRVGEVEMPVDVRLVTPAQFFSAWHHFTGSKEHNVRIRQRAKQFGWKVNEYGIIDTESSKTMTFTDEEEFFAKLGLPYIPPELREDRGEMECAESRRLPDLLKLSDLRGDLHMHTVFSDGADTIYEMALAARERGYEYIAVTDHSRSLKVANGLDIDDLEAQWEEIDRVNRELDGITVLKGIEMDILPDGRLDFPDDVLERLDLVIASVHSSFRQDEKTMTRRLLQAMEHPHVHIIAHPTGRLLLRRDPYKTDLDMLFRKSAETGTILELNANPHRLDLNDELLKRAKEEYGVQFAVNTDAHSVYGLDNMKYGVFTARRGWLEKKDVINTWGLDELIKRLKKK
jgi:DNA polymerase (family 10)